MSLDHEIHIKEENEDLENSSIESNFVTEKVIKTESDISDKKGCVDAKVVLVQETEGFKEYQLPFGWRKEFRKRKSGFQVDKWDVYITG